MLENKVIENAKHNFFKVFIEWANGQYTLNSHSSNEYHIDLEYDILDIQPINSVVVIGNQSVHRLFIPTNESIINYEIYISDPQSELLAMVGNFDIYLSLTEGDLTETLTDQQIKPNLVYIIPAGQYFKLQTASKARYYMAIKKKDSVNINPTPSNLKSIQFEPEETKKNQIDERFA